jgi:glycosyltransferase involved in cell wall biosynthesis
MIASSFRIVRLKFFFQKKAHLADQIIFVNPHIHHSLHTLYALSRNKRIAALCPPAILRLCLSGSIRHLNRLVKYTPLQAILSITSVLLFLLFKCRFINESFYRSTFSLIALRFVHSLRGATLYFYQDYLNDILPLFRPDVRLISEIIIHTSTSTLNWDDSIFLFNYAHSIVVPSRQTLFSIAAFCTSPPVLAPYGGSPDPQFLHKHIYSCQSSASPSDSIFIIARSPSHRKGLDILLEALAILNSLLMQSSSSTTVSVLIAGNIEKGPGLDLFNRYSHQFSSASRICIAYQNLSRQAFLHRLASAELFVMPSRHEGSSTAALEALWSGIPCFLSSACGIDSFVNDDHGLLLKPNTPDKLSQSMFEFCINEECRRRWGCALKRDHDLFGWGYYYDSLSELVN